MPVFDKPEWIHHGGAAILGIDIDASGERLATCGSDKKIRIWSMRPVISESAELNASVPKQLAALSESTTPVNCVRFAPAGRLLAAGSDDSDAYVFELREGRGSAVFGSGEAANLENWKLRLRLRGHEVNVADVAWAPDSRRLATASVDNRVKIWDTTSGVCLRTLEGHIGHVKGLAWDPFDVYLASQGDREVIVWRLEDGQQACRLEDPFVGAPIVSFALRPSWSPDGQVLALPNGYENGVHVVPLIRRNTWAPREFSLVGHRGPVTVVRHNPHLYLSPRSSGGGGGGGEAAAGAPAADDDAGAGGIAAVGSSDKSFSVWHPEVEAPLLVGRGFFDRMINDVAWSADGRVMMLASQDGSVTSVVFQEGDLGSRVSETEVQALMAKLYGDPRLRNQKAALTAAPDLLQLEVRARADVEREERLNNRLGPRAAVAAAVPPPAPVAAGALRPPVPQQRPPVAAAAAAPTVAPSNGSTAQTGRLQPQPSGAAVAASQPAVTSTQRAASPAKPAAPGAGGRAGSGSKDPEVQPAKRPALQPVQLAAAAAAPPPATAAGQQRGGNVASRLAATTGAGSGTTGIPAATASGDAFGAAVPPPAGGGPSVHLVPPEPIKPILSALIPLRSGVAGEVPLTLELQANNTGRDVRQRPVAELVCLSGARRQWSDALQGHVVALAGCSRLIAASTANGDLMVYSLAGRRLFPPIRLGAPASFLSAAAGSGVLVALLADGQLRTWDFAAGESLLEISVAPLLAGDAAQQGLRVAAVRLSSGGSPVVVLSNAYAYVYQTDLRCWMRVADDAFPASAYTSSMSATPGELSRLQASAAQRRHPHDVLAASATHAARPAAASRSEQALLEHNMAAAAPRLRDLISELMGPLRFGSATHAGPGPGLAGQSRGAAAAAFEPPLASSVVGRWQPSILGFDKRRLLREVVLKEVAKNRTYQQLVSEVLDQLKHVDAAAPGQPGHVRPPSGTTAGAAAAVA
ncbi:hypothetical protein VOLCADRAFT_117135, partial [Volvox carteri f. nagariensis]